MAGRWSCFTAAVQPLIPPSAVSFLVRAEHALELSRTLPHAKLAIIPGGHGDYLGEIEARDKHSKIPSLIAAMIDEFLL